MVASKDAWSIITAIKQEYLLKLKTDNPEYYLRMDIKKTPKGLFHLSPNKYVREIIRNHPFTAIELLY